MEKTGRIGSIELKRVSELRTRLLPHLVEYPVARARLVLYVKSSQRYLVCRVRVYHRQETMFSAR